MTAPKVEIPVVPQFLSPEEWEQKQREEQVATDTLQQVERPGLVIDGGGDDEVSLDELADRDGPVHAEGDGPEPGSGEAELAGVADVAAGLVATSDTVDQLFQAMLLAARQHADQATERLAPSMGREYTRMTLTMESLRLMLADEDTADTLGPVAVGIIDHVTSEVQAWLDGTRVPFGTEHPLPEG